MNKLLSRIERILSKKYPTIEEWDYLKSKKQWNDKMDEYGNIMVSRSQQSNEMLYVIMDLE